MRSYTSWLKWCVREPYSIGSLMNWKAGEPEVAEVWFDGANGEGRNGRKQVYDWPRVFALVRRLQPDAVIPAGTAWRPAEADTSILPGGFHHPAEDDRVGRWTICLTRLSDTGNLPIVIPP